jgi:hypothetical protein
LNRNPLPTVLLVDIAFVLFEILTASHIGFVQFRRKTTISRLFDSSPQSRSHCEIANVLWHVPFWFTKVVGLFLKPLAAVIVEWSWRHIIAKLLLTTMH